MFCKMRELTERDHTLTTTVGVVEGCWTRFILRIITRGDFLYIMIHINLSIYGILDKTNLIP